MTSAIQQALQVKKMKAINALDKWFIQAHYTDTGIGAMILESIFQRVLKLPEVAEYLADAEIYEAKKTRFWIIQTAIVKHLQYYIMSKDVEK